MSVGMDNKMSLDNNGLQKVVDTCCRHCVFAKGSFSDKFLQDHLGCEMDVLPRYKKQGEQIDDCIDNDENEFHVVHGRLCPFFRPPNWKGWADKDIEEAKIRVREETRFTPDVVIYYDGELPPDTIMKTINALKDGEVHPGRIYIVNNSKETKPSELVKLLQDCPFPWRMETVTEENCTMLRALDIITKKCEGIFVTYFQAGCQPSVSLFSNIDKAIYDELDKFVCLSPLLGSIDGLTVLRIFYKQADGNARSPIWEKAKKISEEQKCQYLVRPVTQLCQ